MAQYIIRGGRPLSGKVRISGNKNSILPCLAACLLTDKEVTLENVPNISDVKVFIEILTSLGSEVNYKNSTLKICTPKIKTHTLDQNLSRQLRASILLAGPLLAREGQVDFYHPGGDLIGIRPMHQHLEGLTSLGVNFKINDHHYTATRNRTAKTSLPTGKDYFFEESSVTATENLIMFSVLNSGKTILKNCATEPHVRDLCRMLIKMGAKIEGVGSSTLKINGVKKLKGVKFRIGPDYIELGTYAIAAAITRGRITFENCQLKDLEPVIKPLEKIGLIIKTGGSISAYAKNLTAISTLKTNVWPGFPTDLMSAVIVLATQAKGVTLLHDWMYESRMYFVDKIISMGAKITVADPHRVIVSGPSRLRARNLETPDIRAGMALILAALAAKGESVINKIELIDRGYENITGKLSGLGASISRVD